MSSSEQWRPIPGWKGLYEASDHGRVRSLRTGRLLRAEFDRSGYRTAELAERKGRGRVRLPLHRWIMLAFVGPLPAGMETRHLDGDRDNNHLSNLRYGSQSENALDRVRHRTHQWANRTHCPANHPYNDENTRLYQGRRYCRACHNARTLRRYHERKRLELEVDRRFGEAIGRLR